MKFATRSSASLIAVSALAAIAQAEDALYSKRMVKRGIDADGNYNICKSARGDSNIASAHVIQRSSTSTTCMLISMSLAPQEPTAPGPSAAAMVVTRV